MHALVDIILPVFGIILAGYLAGRFGVLGEASSEALNRFVYFFAFPPVLFLSTARAPVADVLNGPFIAASFAGVFGTLAVALVGSRVLFGIRRRAELGLHGLASVFANTGYMGIPLFVAAFGAERTLPAVVVNMFVTLGTLAAAIMVFELAAKPAGHRGGVLGDVGRVVGRNPILVVPFVGLIWASLGIPLASPIVRFLELIGSAAAPAALFAIGLSLIGRAPSGHLAEVGWLTFVKLVVHPALTWLCVRYLFPLDPFWAASAVILAALPVGTLVFIAAQQFNVKVATASATIVLSTAVSVATLAALLVWLGVG